jgi:hypothetical protein
VHYLDSINYAGSRQWALPTTDTTCGSINHCKNKQLDQLFFTELRSTGVGALPTGPFSNVQFEYWYGTEYASIPSVAWGLSIHGNQLNLLKYVPSYAWAVSPGQVTAVPVPGAAWLFGAGLLGLMGLKRRRRAV